jgi:hypothetical protein
MSYADRKIIANEIKSDQSKSKRIKRYLDPWEQVRKNISE